MKASIGEALIHDQKTEFLNLNKYENQTTMIKPEKMRAALIETIQEKYLKPIMKKMGDEELQNMHSRAERDFYNLVRSNTITSDKTGGGRHDTRKSELEKDELTDGAAPFLMREENYQTMQPMSPKSLALSPKSIG